MPDEDIAVDHPAHAMSLAHERQRRLGDDVEQRLDEPQGDSGRSSPSMIRIRPRQALVALMR